jgi:hypothetical protein
VLLVSLYSKNSVIFVIKFGTLANHDIGAKIYSVSHFWFVQKSRQLLNIDLSLSISEKSTLIAFSKVSAKHGHQFYISSYNLHFLQHFNNDCVAHGCSPAGGRGSDNDIWTAGLG